MAKLNQNFTMYPGDTETVQFTVTDSQGNPLNITGASIDWYLKGSRPVDTQAIVHKTMASGITITNATSGVFQVKLSPTDTSSLSVGTYAHRATITDASGNVSTVATGTVTLTQ